jgi:Uma2 family endonuclease
MTADLDIETMSAEAFLEWADRQDEGDYQLIDGRIERIAPENLEQSHVRFQSAIAMDAAIANAGVHCRAFVRGPGVKIDDTTVFVPDAHVNRGAPIPRASLIAPNPVIVVEVVSPTSTRRDLAVKFTNYFRHPGVRHYLIAVMENRTVIQHSRSEGDTLKTRIAGPGDRLTFDPPGIAVAVSDLFKDLDSAFAD